MNDSSPPNPPIFNEHQCSQLDSLEGVIRIDAGAIADASGGVIRSGSIVVRREKGTTGVLASGLPSAVDAVNLPPITHHLAMPDRLLMPGLINAHAHLDLTHIGVHPHEPEDGFVSWVDMIRARRHTEDDQITGAVELGIEKLLAGGTAAVGDIAGAPNGRMTLAPLHALRDSPIAGVSYLEFFGIGTTKDRTNARIESFIDHEYEQLARSLAGSSVRAGLQPHAPNTVDCSIYEMLAKHARALGIPLSTHLAETPEEHEFIETGTGPQRALLERLGVWDDSILDSIAQGNHPVAHLQHALATAPFLVAHLNDATDEAIAILAQTGTVVVYCPRASEYFGAAHNFGHHRYQAMLDAGVKVCLGTDSIVNLDTPDRISVLDEMRLLHQRDATEPQTLLRMATLHATAPLGLDEQGFTLAAQSAPLGLLGIVIDPSAVDPWGDAMRSDSPPAWVFAPVKPTY